jgi:hypothetical protein
MALVTSSAAPVAVAASPAATRAGSEGTDYAEHACWPETQNGHVFAAFGKNACKRCCWRRSAADEESMQGKLGDAASDALGLRTVKLE